MLLKIFAKGEENMNKDIAEQLEKLLNKINKYACSDNEEIKR